MTEKRKKFSRGLWIIAIWHQVCTLIKMIWLHKEHDWEYTD